MVRTVLILLLSVGLAGASCHRSVTQSLLISEAFLSTTGNEFASAADEITGRCDAVPRQIPGLDQEKAKKFCDNFRAFERKFRPAFALSVNLWRVARETRDISMEKNTGLIIRSLLDELAPFVAQLAALAGGK